MKGRSYFACCLVLLFFGIGAVPAATYEVGPGKAFTSLGGVPWESLAAGDTVLIHDRAEPYAEKFVLCRQGTASQPITVRGVPGAAGELPVLEGSGATTRLNLSFWGESRAIIKIGGASIPADTTPKFITIENIEIRGARPPFTFTDDDGVSQSYQNNAASIWIEKGENITVRNCILHDSGNGFFVSSSDTSVSRNILVEGCHIFDNGNTNSIYEHNVYTAALDITFQFNRFGPLRSGCAGNNLKDRSAGLVVRYNWLEGGNRELDLVDGQDSTILRNDPAYRSTFVYGNVILEPNADGNKQLIHYGGDSGTTANYRKGTLYFYNNTVVSKRPDQTTLFRLSTNEERVDARNNIFYVTNTGQSLALLDSAGVLNLSNNWLKSGFVNSFSTLSGSVTKDGTNIVTNAPPGFVDETIGDFRLALDSACVDAGGNLHTNAAAAHPLLFQYVKHQTNEARSAAGPLDIGAFEFEPPLEQWRNEEFGSAATNDVIAANDADPDGDGVVNLMEYALGMDPLANSKQGLPAPAVISTNGVSHLALTFTRRPPPCGITYTVQSSTNLVNWKDGCSYSDTTNVTATAEMKEVSSPAATNKVVRLNTTIEDSPKTFLRLTVREG